MEKLIRNLGTKLLALTVACLVCFASSPAMADQGTCIKRGPIHIEDGSFSYSVTRDVSEDFTVRSAIVSLPEGETGMIDSILITRPDEGKGCPGAGSIVIDGKPVCVEFGCSGIKVENDTDLVAACGGPAVLKASETTYTAKGSDFKPQATFNDFSIELCDDFAKK
ncbi:MAG: hypothetical protein F6K30_16955 [Cyanothece sp. SIO2G6]|nr:hypothetical protein [Cyanothece sp. SIO2G6]